MFWRIFFAILGFCDVIGIWVYKHFYLGLLSPNKFRFPYYGFEWVQPLPEPFFSIYMLTLLVAALGIGFGYRYRLSTFYFALGYSYLFLLDKTFYLNHGYLFSVLSWLMVFMPLDRSISITTLHWPSYQWSRLPRWPLSILRFSMGVVYFYGGIAKINADWLHGIPLKIWLRQKKDHLLLGPLLEQEWMAYFMSYGGLILDLSITFFLLFRQTRKIALLALVFFHTMNMLIFKIGIFPFLSMGLSLLFLPPDWPTKFIRQIKKASNWPAKILEWVERKLQAWTGKIKQKTFRKSGWGRSMAREGGLLKPGYQLLLASYILFMLIMPLRHHWFEGHPAWTEEGHRYSWRMMLRTKHGTGNFKLVDLRTGETKRVDARDYMTYRQRRKMYTHPDMILYFAHYLEKESARIGMDSVAIYANIRVRLNGRTYVPMIDASTDLTKEKWSFFKTSPWITGRDSVFTLPRGK